MNSYINTELYKYTITQGYKCITTQNTIKQAYLIRQVYKYTIKKLHNYTNTQI